LQLRLADRWPDARAMQAAVRNAYVEMCGVAPPVGAPAARSAEQSVPQGEGPRESPVPASVVTTVLAREVPRRRQRRLVALGSASVLAAMLGFVGAQHERRAREPLAASAQLADLGEATASLAGPATPASASATSPSTLPGMTARPPASISTQPAARSHHRSIYDRRY
jgi:hypothetical protein